MNEQALEAKKAAVKAVEEGFKNCTSLVIVSYQGLTVAEMQNLRRDLEKAESVIGVYKNTLVKRALKDVMDPALEEILNGPNALVFSKELSKGPKALVKFGRYHEALVIKGGVVEGKVVDADRMKAIAKLPDKNGLLSMFLSVLNAPITKFAATVKAVADKQAPASTEAAAN